MSINLTAINSGIKTILDGIAGDGEAFALALDAPAKQPAKYPVIYPILDRSFPMEKSSNRRNFIPVAFVVRGVMEVNQYSAAAYAEMLTLIGTTMTELQKKSNRTLGGVAHNVDDVSLLSWDYLEDATRPVIVFDIGFVVKIISDTGD